MAILYHIYPAPPPPPDAPPDEPTPDAPQLAEAAEEILDKAEEIEPILLAKPAEVTASPPQYAILEESWAAEKSTGNCDRVLLDTPKTVP